MPAFRIRTRTRTRTAVSLFGWLVLVVNDRRFSAKTVFFSHTKSTNSTSSRTSNDQAQPNEQAECLGFGQCMPLCLPARVMRVLHQKGALRRTTLPVAGKASTPGSNSRDEPIGGTAVWGDARTRWRKDWSLRPVGIAPHALVRRPAGVGTWGADIGSSTAGFHVWPGTS